MAKLVRCIEGHVYDVDRNDVCPVCGAEPSDAASSVDPDISRKSDFATLPRATQAQAGAPKVPALPWLAAAGVALLIVGAAIYGLTSGSEPKPNAQSEQAAEPEDAPSESDETTIVSAGDPHEKPKNSQDGPPVGTQTEPAKRAEEQADAPPENSTDREIADTSQSLDASAGDEQAALRVRAQKHLANRDYDSAIADLTDIIRTGEGTSDDYRLRGSAYHAKRQKEPALADYNRAVEFEDHDAEAHYYRATLYRDIGDIDKAIEDLTEAIEEHGSTNARLYGERALMFERKSLFDQAVADYDTGIELLDKDPTADKNIKAVARYQRGQAKMQAIRKRRDFCSTLVGAGDCHYHESLTDPLEDFKAAVDLVPNLTAVHLEIGIILAELGKKEEALAAYTDAIRLDPSYSLAYAHRCLAYNLAGEKDLALADCNDAIRHDSNNGLAWAYRGTVYGSKRGRKNRNLAIADFRKALQVDPNNYLARESLKKLGAKP
ncbi:MAG: tetratricopeptide repeat protein [Pseudomonadota bacterium]